MRHQHLKQLLTEAKLSPEQLAKLSGISNMTLRRMLTRDPDEVMDAVYARSLRDAVMKLVIDGKLSADTAIGQFVLSSEEPLVFQVALKNLGILEESGAQAEHLVPASPDGPDAHDKMVLQLSRIGMNPEHQQAVDGQGSLLERFRRIGAEWSEKIESLKVVVQSRQMAITDKLVAYGALFYLITPLDLIPDYLAGVGLVDDFGMLTLAAGFYLKRFPKIG